MAPTPKLWDLEVLLAVARHGSFGRAATDLLISQPAVSDRIRNLERTLGCPLVERSNRGAKLTAAGERLAAYAARCVALAEEAAASVRDEDRVPRFVVAGHSTFGASIIPLVFGALTTLPRRVVLRDAHSHEVLALVQDGVADLGVTMAATTPSGVERVGLPPDEVICIVGDEHRLAASRAIDLPQLTCDVIALNAWGDGASHALDRLHAAVDEWRVRECADASTVIALARDHDHIGFVAASAAQPALGHGAIRQVAVRGLPRWTVRTQLVHRRDRRQDPAIAAVRGAIHALRPKA